MDCFSTTIKPCSDETPELTEAGPSYKFEWGPRPPVAASIAEANPKHSIRKGQRRAVRAELPSRIDLTRHHVDISVFFLATFTA